MCSSDLQRLLRSERVRRRHIGGCGSVLLQLQRRQHQQQHCFGQHDGQQYQLHHLKQHVDLLQRHIVDESHLLLRSERVRRRHIGGCGSVLLQLQLQQQQQQKHCFGQHDGQQYQLHHLKHYVDRLQRFVRNIGYI